MGEPALQPAAVRAARARADVGARAGAGRRQPRDGLRQGEDQDRVARTSRRSRSPTSPVSTKRSRSSRRSRSSSSRPAKFQQMGAKIPKGVLLLRAAGHRQDAARQGGRGRGRRAVLLDQRLRLRRDVRRRRRVTGARPVRAGEGGGAGDRVRRRDRRRRSSPRRRARRRSRRARADAQPAARRDGRLRPEAGRDPARVDEPSRHPRPRVAAARDASTARSSSTVPTSKGARRSSRCTPRRSRSRPASISTSSPGARPGFTGADLANLMNEAALLSARHDLELIGLPQLEEAIDRVMAGPGAPEPPDLRAREARDRVPRRRPRAGRARVARTPTRCTRSRSSRAAARSGTRSRCPPKTSSSCTRSELVDELAMLLGGRTAEELIFADPTTGAQNDIDRATTIARQMVTEFGMSDALGPMRFGHPQGEVFLGRDFTRTPDYSDEVAAQHRRRGAPAHRRRARSPRSRCSPRTARSLDRLAARADRARDARSGTGAGDLRRRAHVGRRTSDVARGARAPDGAPRAPSRSRPRRRRRQTDQHRGGPA